VNDLLVVVVTQTSAQLLVVHLGLVLAHSPQSGHLVRVGQFELPPVTRPGDTVLAALVRQQLEQELPQLDRPAAGIAGEGSGRDGRAGVNRMASHDGGWPEVGLERRVTASTAYSRHEVDWPVAPAVVQVGTVSRPRGRWGPAVLQHVRLRGHVTGHELVWRLVDVVRVTACVQIAYHVKKVDRIKRSHAYLGTVY
jgi:hypothetical protein